MNRWIGSASQLSHEGFSLLPLGHIPNEVSYLPRLTNATRPLLE
jgi:hypothetical protein